MFGFGTVGCSTPSNSEVMSESSLAAGSNEVFKQSVPSGGLETQKERFEVSGDVKTVRDNITSLLWQQTPGAPPDSNCGTSSSCTWQEARYYCAKLNLHGQQWQLSEGDEYPITKSSFIPRRRGVRALPPREISLSQILNKESFTNVRDRHWTSTKGALPIFWGVLTILAV